jgi:hypothetical protein
VLFAEVVIWTAMLSGLEDGPLNEDTEHCILDLCRYHDSIGSLPSVELPGENREQILSRLRAAGYTLVERQDLVERLQ